MMLLKNYYNKTWRTADLKRLAVLFFILVKCKWENDCKSENAKCKLSNQILLSTYNPQKMGIANNIIVLGNSKSILAEIKTSLK